MDGIREEWLEYYDTLEAIRKSGVTNMYGAAPYLAKIEGIDEKLAKGVLVSWMKNYAVLKEKRKWN